MAAAGTKTGYLFNEQQGWNSAWFVLNPPYFMAFNTPTDTSCAQFVTVAGGVEVVPSTTHNRPFCFVVTTKVPMTTVWVLAAASDKDMHDWIAALLAAATMLPPQLPQQQAAPAQPVAEVAPVMPNDPVADNFWNSYFGKLEEVSWKNFIQALADAYHVSPALHQHQQEAIFCLLNMFCEGALKTRGVTTKLNFYLFNSVFGPLQDYVDKCVSTVSCGYFHGDQTSAESEELLHRAGLRPGAFLIRMRKGAKNQMALAYVDAAPSIKHTLINATNGKYYLNAAGGSFRLLPELIAAYNAKLTSPVTGNIMAALGPNQIVSATPISAAEHENELLRKQLEEAQQKLQREEEIKKQQQQAVLLAQQQAQMQAEVERRKKEEETKLEQERLAKEQASKEAAAAASKSKELLDETERLRRELADAKLLLQNKQAEVQRLAKEKEEIATTQIKSSELLQHLATNMKAGVVLNIKIPVLEARRKMKFEQNLTVRDAAHKILRSIPVKDQEYLQLFNPKTGIWLDESRQLKSYLLTDDDNLEFVYKSTEACPPVVRVFNEPFNDTQFVVIGSRTTVLGVIQALEKKDMTNVGRFGIYHPRSGGSGYFCDPRFKLSDFCIQDKDTLEFRECRGATLYTPDTVPAAPAGSAPPPPPAPNAMKLLVPGLINARQSLRPTGMPGGTGTAPAKPVLKKVQPGDKTKPAEPKQEDELLLVLKKRLALVEKEFEEAKLEELKAASQKPAATTAPQSDHAAAAAAPHPQAASQTPPTVHAPQMPPLVHAPQPSAVQPVQVQPQVGHAQVPQQPLQPQPQAPCDVMPAQPQSHGWGTHPVEHANGGRGWAHSPQHVGSTRAGLGSRRTVMMPGGFNMGVSSPPTTPSPPASPATPAAEKWAHELLQVSSQPSKPETQTTLRGLFKAASTPAEQQELDGSRLVALKAQVANNPRVGMQMLECVCVNLPQH
eukprot:TRINITY_DN2456_c0_g1_i2.p1 TRINITY_DN2456_c0_g1~~TRINITY_DN2456_c0_g1_i2.p1  ORF type:complete len:953 (-),score=230.74 TRINITY_DN2456_c0_g1_i2:72-2930(-)